MGILFFHHDQGRESTLYGKVKLVASGNHAMCVQHVA